MKIHFIGIGGIGVSALARYYLAKGWQVSGSDLVSSEITDALKEKGSKIFIPHQSKLGAGQVGKHKLPDLVIYSPAIPENNPELQNARKLGIKCQSYPEALGELTKQYFTIAVCGTHGKSTTSAMIGLILEKAGLDPFVILGTKLKEFGNSNFRMGKPTFRAVSRFVPRGSAILVIEADEHFASFLNYWPKIIVLTNLEPDHLDYYKNFKNYIFAFKKFIFHLPQKGWLIANRDDKNVFQLVKNKKLNIRFYSLKQPEAKKLEQILKVPGEHNVSNALAALKVARVLKIPDKISFKALSEYRGSWRRFDITKILYPKPYTLISDYAHHPTQIRVTLRAAREKFPKKKIWCLFQPHQYQRTFYLFKDFVKVFKKVLSQKWIDKLIITDIYDVAGREEKRIKKKMNSEKLIKAINKREAIYPHTMFGVGVYLPKEEIIDYLKKNLKGKEVLIIMGAGDIYDISKEIFS